MGFKEDAGLPRFVSMGAVGTATVAAHLRSRHGHQPIELERYAMANKVWQTKVKRLRLPDLVCTRCGRRVGSRAKSRLGIELSDSDTPGPEWHAGGYTTTSCSHSSTLTSLAFRHERERQRTLPGPRSSLP